MTTSNSTATNMTYVVLYGIPILHVILEWRHNKKTNGTCLGLMHTWISQPSKAVNYLTRH